MVPFRCELGANISLKPNVLVLLLHRVPVDTSIVEITVHCYVQKMDPLGTSIVSLPGIGRAHGNDNYDNKNKTRRLP